MSGLGPGCPHLNWRNGEMYTTWLGFTEEGERLARKEREEMLGRNGLVLDADTAHECVVLATGLWVGKVRDQ